LNAAQQPVLWLMIVNVLHCLHSRYPATVYTETRPVA